MKGSCPRCIIGLLKDNGDHYYTRCQCGFTVYGATFKYAMCVIGLYLVSWETKGKFCVVSSTPANLKGTELPWLPYTVSINELAKYLILL